ncbi:hypothetical protein QNH20_12760 [Neobacillus sp. WH10]|uniref:hypothetical protein n=1 Tax=Neobacillus sp. WH10 TaxID=3047873 RepID=UPI0024C17DC1|nr:hypothetical protein [Neobacillus sp. WH10]WHY79952.1 hypothetical protein QNH20_12760 [Neobacillus sp. WH10]
MLQKQTRKKTTFKGTLFSFFNIRGCSQEACSRSSLGSEAMSFIRGSKILRGNIQRRKEVIIRSEEPLITLFMFLRESIEAFAQQLQPSSGTDTPARAAKL